MGETWSKGTICDQGGYTPKNGEPRVLPLYQSTTYKYDTAEDLAALFDLHADKELELIHVAGARTIVIHPARTTQRQLTEGQQRSARIEDSITDLDQAMAGGKKYAYNRG